MQEHKMCNYYKAKGEKIMTLINILFFVTLLILLPTALWLMIKNEREAEDKIIKKYMTNRVDIRRIK